MFKVESQKGLNLMLRLSKFLTWFIPIYITLCFAICSYGGLRFLYSHFSEAYKGFSDLERVSYLDKKQELYFLWALGFGVLICAFQCCLIFLIRKTERNFEKEIANLRLILSESNDENKKLAAENIDMKNQLCALSVLRQNIVTVIQNYLTSVADSLHFTAKERITFYVIDPERKNFNIIKRYARNSEWRPWSEMSCPLNVGVRGRAWATGSSYVGSFPDYDEQPQKYRDKARKLGYTDEQINAFKMKARTYFAYRYDSLDKQKHDAIVVIESMTSYYRSKKELRKEIERCGNLIYHLVRDFYDFIPRGIIATQEGL